MRDDEGNYFRLIFHFGKWDLKDNYLTTVSKLCKFYNFIKDYIAISIEPEIKLYCVEKEDDTFQQISRIETAVNYIREHCGQIEAISDYPDRYGFGNIRSRKNKDSEVYEIPSPAYFHCNKCLLLRIRPNGPFITHGYCCGETIPLETFIEDFSPSKFQYDISRDWTYCTQQKVMSHTLKGFVQKLSETDSWTLGCNESHKLQEYKC